MHHHQRLPNDGRPSRRWLSGRLRRETPQPGAKEPPDSLRVLLVVTGLQVGGAERQVVQLARGLVRRGHVVRLVTLIPPTNYLDDLAVAGVMVNSLGMRPGLPDPRATRRLRRLVRTWTPHVVHSHLVHANLLARVACRGALAPLVCTSHNTHEGAAWRQLAYRFTDRWCTVTTAICEAAARRRVEQGAVPPGRIRVIPNGINPSDLSTEPSTRASLRRALHLGKRFTWLFAGRLHPQKDVATLLRAFAPLGESVLLIAGDGPDRSTLEWRARSFRDRVHFLGMRKDLPALMAAADGFVMSSAWEGLPMVLLEAQWMALPCVCTDVGGVADALSTPRPGQLVPPGDAAALSAAMSEIMTLSDSAREALGAVGHGHVERGFLIDPVIERYVDLYRSIAAV